jgi:hypothetical protein
MKKNKKLLILLSAVLLSIIALSVALKLTNKNTTSPQKGSNYYNISDSFILKPDSSYSIKENIVEEKIQSVPPIPERINIKIDFTNNYPKPLWFNYYCDVVGVLEKKTTLGWQEVDDDNNCDEKIGSFVNRGNNHLNNVLFASNGKGTYRLKVPFSYGCISNKEGGKIVYNNCEGKALAISPEFAIVE